MTDARTSAGRAISLPATWKPRSDSWRARISPVYVTLSPYCPVPSIGVRTGRTSGLASCLPWHAVSNAMTPRNPPLVTIRVVFIVVLALPNESVRCDRYTVSAKPCIDAVVPGLPRLRIEEYVKAVRYPQRVGKIDQESEGRLRLPQLRIHRAIFRADQITNPDHPSSVPL